MKKRCFLGHEPATVAPGVPAPSVYLTLIVTNCQIWPTLVWTRPSRSQVTAGPAPLGSYENREGFVAPLSSRLHDRRAAPSSLTLSLLVGP
eukprot:130219-Prymnesium_polylepis.1